MTRRKKVSVVNDERRAVAKMAAELAELGTLTVAQLRNRFFEVFERVTKSRNKDYLRKKVAWRIQELAEGGLSTKAQVKIDELAADTPIRCPAREKRLAAAEAKSNRDPRLPAAGTELTRTYKGADYVVTVGENDFEYAGERFRSLSKIARAITGTSWNGFVFFGLKAKQTAEAKP